MTGVHQLSLDERSLVCSITGNEDIAIGKFLAMVVLLRSGMRRANHDRRGWWCGGGDLFGQIRYAWPVAMSSAECELSAVAQRCGENGEDQDAKEHDAHQDDRCASEPRVREGEREGQSVAKSLGDIGGCIRGP